uniref:HD-Zip IV C-terminal domain-containing protein n=1 Tax=Nelumbo nucifera TaxID=4432 RepID=A0A822Y9R9_NELNU|nr:TPA_asm: hypothetical protein HUJ06_030311 [Nelumbo nucifera]
MHVVMNGGNTWHCCPGDLLLYQMVAFQILVNNLPTAKNTMESVEIVNNLISCMVQKIKAALSLRKLRDSEESTMRRVKVRVLAVIVLTCLKTTN